MKVSCVPSPFSPSLLQTSSLSYLPLKKKMERLEDVHWHKNFVIKEQEASGREFFVSRSICEIGAFNRSTAKPHYAGCVLPA